MLGDQQSAQLPTGHDCHVLLLHVLLEGADQAPLELHVYEQLPVVPPTQVPVIGVALFVTAGKLQLEIVVAGQPAATQVLLEGVVHEPKLQL